MAKQLWNVNFSTLNVSNDINFKAFGGKYTNSANLTNGVYTADGEGSTPAFSINAVDIDWNGAELSLPNELGLGTTITINTTRQLLNANKEAS